MEFELNSGNKIFNKFSSAIQNQYLIGFRVASEVITNLIQLSLRSLKSPITMVKSSGSKYKSRVQKVMEATGSPLIEKTKFKSSNQVTLQGGKLMQKENNLIKLNNFINGLSEGMFTAGMWMPKFEAKFKELTGVDWNDSFLDDAKYYYDIQTASAYADFQIQSVLRGAMKAQTRQKILFGIEIPYTNKFYGFPVPADDFRGTLLGLFQGFLYNDYKQAIIGSKMLFEKGVRVEGLSKIAGVTTNLLAYALLTALLKSFTKLAWGDDDEKEKAKKDLQQLTTPKGVAKYAWLSVLESFITFWVSGQNNTGRMLVELSLQAAYKSDVFDDKSDLEKLMTRMNMKPFSSPMGILRAAPIPVAYKELSNIIWSELEALADKQNVSVTSLVNRFADYAQNDKADDLNPEEYEVFQLLAGSWYLGNLIMMSTTGTYIPLTKEMKSAVDQMLDDATIIGGKDLWEAADLNPEKNVKIQGFTKERDEELSALATEKMNDKIDAEREQLDNYIQEGNIWALRYELFRLKENSKREVFNQEGLPGEADYPELPPFTDVNTEGRGFGKFKVTEYKKVAEQLSNELMKDEQLSNTLNNSSSRVIKKYKDLYLPELSKSITLNRQPPSLSSLGLAEERDEDGNVIRYIEVPKKK
jgi:hypothetical protein